MNPPCHGHNPALEPQSAALKLLRPGKSWDRPGRLTIQNGWTVGLGIDPDEPGWPVLYVDSPAGQLSWHLPAAEVNAAAWPNYPGT